MKDWILLHRFYDLQRAYILKAHLEAEQVPAVVVPRQSSAYPGIGGAQAEVWVRLTDGPQATLLLDKAFDENDNP